MNQPNHQYQTTNELPKNHNQNQNPLKGFFRNYSLWISLPSKEMGFYPEQVMETNEDNEVGIMPMTGQDEIILKNPDALLNGEAMRQVLTSCCPQIKRADDILLNDVEALMIGIRIASYGKEMEMDTKCPQCNATNTVAMNLEDVLHDVDYLDADHSVVIANDNGQHLRVHFVPYMYKSYLKLQKQSFEEEKIIRGLERLAERGEDDLGIKMKSMSQSYDRMAKLNFELMVECVHRITSEEDDSIDVTDRKFIAEFVANISSKNARKISDELERIMEIGVRHEFKARCQKCDHEWDEKMTFDPSTFF